MNSGLFPDPLKIVERVESYIKEFKAGNDVRKFAQIKEQRFKPKK